jgi:flagellar hook-associated protein 2
MSGITSGIGLISGINRQQLIEQLIALEGRPVAALQSRVQALDTQRAAYLELSAKLLAVQNAVLGFNRTALFSKFSATSGNAESLTASAQAGAVPGTHTFRVRSLATNQMQVSRGFADSDRTPLGAGTITIESALARVDRDTELDVLNGFRGVRGGIITITDRSGARAEVDLTAAVTVEDVLDAIRSAPGLRVRVGVTGDRIFLEDVSGGETGVLVVSDVAGGFTAADLGIAGRADGLRLEGSGLLRITEDTPLSFLNDRNGVGRRSELGTDLNFQTSYGDFGVSLADALDPRMSLRALNGGNGVRLGVIRVTDRSGRSAEIDLSRALTVQDVLDAVESADVGVSVVVSGSGIRVQDTSVAATEAPLPLKIEDISGFAAADLGLAGQTSSNAIIGKDLYRVDDVGDLLRAINLAPGNQGFVEAAISPDGKSLRWRALGFDNSVTVTAGEGSTAARDLGLQGFSFQTNDPLDSRKLIGGLQTVLLDSLRGGAGVVTGQVRFTNRAGGSVVIDFAGAATLQDVIDRIHADPTLGLTASINGAGNGLSVRDESEGTGTLTIADVTGRLAADLGIATSTLSGESADFVDGGNLQLRYVSRATRLTDFVASGAFRGGELRITDATGAVFTVAVASNLKTVGEVIDAINLRTPDTMEARINDRGDGITLTDRSGGSGTLSVRDETGSAAASQLRLAGAAAAGNNFLEGTLETRITLGAHDTLRDAAAKINAAEAGVTATVINDGRGLRPYALSLAADSSGRRGQFVFDSGDLRLGMETLVRAQDAVVTLGGAGGGKVVTSSTNTLDELIEGLQIELHAPTTQDVTVTVAQDTDAIVDSLRSFIDQYNEVQAAIDDHTSFNQDTLERGVLLGDSTVNLIRSRLQRLSLQPFGGEDESGSGATTLAAIGIRRAAGNRLELDEDRFRDAYEQTPDAVERALADSVQGAGAAFKEGLEALTGEFDGVLVRRNNTLAEQQSVLNERIDEFNRRLDRSRARLEAQFVGLENALAGLQQQQNAITSLIAQLAQQR